MDSSENDKILKLKSWENRNNGCKENIERVSC